MDSYSFKKMDNNSYNDMNIINNINNINNQSSNNKIIFNNNSLTLYKTDNFDLMLKQDKSTQTDYKLLYQKEEKKENDKKKEKEEKEEKEESKQKKRKFDADLMRDKIFKYFNKMVYNWLKISENKNDKINIYYFKFKNNKTIINECMNKQLKNLFLDQKENNAALGQRLKKTNNKLLIEKLQYRYEDIYKLFISQKEKINETKELLDNFYFLDDFLEELKKKNENNEYLSRLKEVALNYEIWKNKKAHLWGKKK